MTTRVRTRMTCLRSRLSAAVAALGATLVFAVPIAAAIQPEPQMMFETGTTLLAPVAGVLAAAPPMPQGGPGAMPRGGPEGLRGEPPLLPPFIRLTSEQEDKLFEMRHAQEPALRATTKTLHSAHAQLFSLALADTYDEARAKELAARAAQASGELALMRARLQHAAFTLLTPEQRKRLEQCRPGADGAPARDCMPPPPR